MAMLATLSVVKDKELTEKVLTGRWSLEEGAGNLTLVSGFGEGDIQCDQFVSRDGFMTLTQQMGLMDILCAELLDPRWHRVSRNFCSGVTDLNFPANVVPSNVLVTLVNEALADQFLTIATLKHDSVYRCDLSTVEGCIAFVSRAK
jgi:hypothetical protein